MEKKMKMNVAVLGASGVVGQVFLHRLSNHKWFELSIITGSGSRAGKTYGDDVQWVLPVPMPESVRKMKIETLDITQLKKSGIKIVFSALPADVAKTVEPELRKNHFYVFSNAGALRCERNVPILIPEVNPETLEYIKQQGFPDNGFVVTNANCSTTGLAVALAPLKTFGIKEVFVSTYQSVSGAGYPGLSALDIMGNVIPYIQREEEKMKIELKKILQLDTDAEIYPHCVRIPVLFGHLETVWLTFEKPVEEADILEAWRSFELNSPTLPSLPQQPVVYMDNKRFPQPKMSFWGSPSGMQVFTGRLRKERDKIGFTLLVNNLVKGAAGGSIGNAELFFDVYGYQFGLGGGQ
ncbi:MAG: aspartate-semialdehyde dehydrogenase [Candidatus Aminicenantes bacterium]|nr:MAG: aspartate-semialdehyde dehydrogenase [Candidatus Aminicenantes bacterium]